MPRHARLKLGGTPLHVMQRGVNRCACFSGEADYGVYLALLDEIAERYVQYFNRKHKRTGTLWQGRFRSSLVDSEGYLLRCHRYIELNPVRAGMVRDPLDFCWSSHAANARGALSTISISPHPLYLSLGPDDAARQSVYRSMFGEDLTSDDLREIREAARGGFALGRPAFIAHLQRALKKRVVQGTNGRPRKHLD